MTMELIHDLNTVFADYRKWIADGDCFVTVAIGHQLAAERRLVSTVATGSTPTTVRDRSDGCCAGCT